MKRVALLAALTALLAGCGTSKDEGISGGGKVIGKTVTVYSLTSDPGGASRDFVDGEKLALADAGGRAGALAVNFTSLDLGGDDDSCRPRPRGARSATRRSSPRSSTRRRVTVPLFNAAGILQVAAGRRPEPGDATRTRCRPASTRSARCRRQAVPADFDARFEKAFGRDPAPSAPRTATARWQGVAGGDRRPRARPATTAPASSTSYFS